MPSTIERNLNLCFTKLKRHHPTPQSPPPPPTITTTFNTLYNLPPDDPPTPTPSFIPSDRFFFSSPGLSNSIIDSSTSSTSTSFTATDGVSVSIETPIGGGGVAIPTISPDPYWDFRKSMQEMVEARDLLDVRANWDYLHELLTCYLELNPKSAHKFIVGAFADLLVSLMAAESGGRSS